MIFRPKIFPQSSGALKLRPGLKTLHSETINELVKAYRQNLCSTDQNAQRLLMEVILPKFVGESKERGESKIVWRNTDPYSFILREFLHLFFENME